MNAKYKRVILKLSGEALGGESSIIDSKKIIDVVLLVKKLVQNNIQVGIVVGAGNIFRGRIANENGVDTISGDYMGMIGTVINMKAISSVLNKYDVKNVLFSALAVDDVAIKYSKVEANKKFDDGYVVLFAGGIGKPGYTTDTTAATRAIETSADMILAGKFGVKGVYDSDPRVNKNAKFLKNLTYSEVLDRDLKVMDRSAIELLKETSIVTRVFSMNDINNFILAIESDEIGTTIKE